MERIGQRPTLLYSTKKRGDIPAETTKNAAREEMFKHHGTVLYGEVETRGRFGLFGWQWNRHVAVLNFRGLLFIYKHYVEGIGAAPPYTGKLFRVDCAERVIVKMAHGVAQITLYDNANRQVFMRIDGEKARVWAARMFMMQMPDPCNSGLFIRSDSRGFGSLPRDTYSSRSLSISDDGEESLKRTKKKGIVGAEVAPAVPVCRQVGKPTDSDKPNESGFSDSSDSGSDIAWDSDSDDRCESAKPIDSPFDVPAELSSPLVIVHQPPEHYDSAKELTYLQNGLGPSFRCNSAIALGDAALATPLTLPSLSMSEESLKPSESTQSSESISDVDLPPPTYFFYRPESLFECDVHSLPPSSPKLSSMGSDEDDNDNTSLSTKESEWSFDGDDVSKRGDLDKTTFTATSSSSGPTASVEQRARYRRQLCEIRRRLLGDSSSSSCCESTKGIDETSHKRDVSYFIPYERLEEEPISSERPQPSDTGTRLQLRATPDSESETQL